MTSAKPGKKTNSGSAVARKSSDGPGVCADAQTGADLPGNDVNFQCQSTDASSTKFLSAAELDEQVTFLATVTVLP